MKVLITGSAGFIGSALSLRLLDRGDEVVGIDNHNDYYDPELKEARLNRHLSHQNYKHIRMDIENKEIVELLFKENEFDCVVNLAAQAGVRYSIDNPLQYVNTNIVGFAHILEGCRHNNIKHLVYASSSSVYGANTSMPFSTHDNVDHPLSLYAASKKANELMAHTYSNLYNLPTTGLRFFTVYGPWSRPDMALFLFTDAILNNKPIKVFNNGDLSRDFTYIDDIIQGVENTLLKSVNEKERYKLYNICNNQPVQLLDFIEAIEKSTGKTSDRILMPMQAGDVNQTWANVGQLKTDYDYEPSTALEVGVEAFVNWYKAYYS